MELKIILYLSNVAIAVNISQPSVRIGGGLHALIHIFFLHGGSKSAKPFWDLKGSILRDMIKSVRALSRCDTFKRVV